MSPKIKTYTFVTDFIRPALSTSLSLIRSCSLDILKKNRNLLSKGLLIVNIYLFSLYKCGILMPHLDFINRETERENQRRVINRDEILSIIRLL